MSDYENLSQWRPMPSNWMTGENGLKKLKRGAHTSVYTAALMVFFVLCLDAPVCQDPLRGISKDQTNITYDNIVNLCGISKKLVSNGLKLLEEWGLIKKQKTGKSNLYFIPHRSMIQGDGQFCKIPFRYFAKRKKTIYKIFAHINMRDASSLDALKIYFWLLRNRKDNFTLESINKQKRNGVCLSYSSIEDALGIPRNNIKKAINILASNDLIYWETITSDQILQKNTQYSGYNFNFYQIRGLWYEDKN